MFYLLLDSSLRRLLPTLYVGARILMGWLLVGCTAMPSATPTIIFEEVPKITSVDTETTASLVPSPISPSTLTPIPATATPEIPTEAQLRVRCLEIMETFPPNFKSEGTVILELEEGILRSYKRNLMNMETGHVEQIAQPNEILALMSVSPNQRWLAYHRALFDQPIADSQPHEREILEDEVVVESFDRSQRLVYPQSQVKGFLVGWLNDQQLIFSLAQFDSEENKGLKSPTMMLFNPFTAQQRLLKPGYPNLYDFPDFPNWDSQGITSYSPSVEQVVYYQGSISDPRYYHLWDLVHHQSIHLLGPVYGTPHMPRWAPDGMSYAVAPETDDLVRELLQISREGEVQRLTYLTDYFSTVIIGDFSWSADGRSIAFWLSSWMSVEEAEDDKYDDFQEQLAVLNLDTGLVTAYCVPGDELRTWTTSRVPEPLWSPDGTQVIVMNRSVKWPTSKVILVDLEEEIAFQIAEYAQPAGWLISGD